MAEVKRPQTPVQPEPQAKKDEQDWDGQGNRVQAVRQEKVDVKLVANGLTSVPLTDADLTASDEDSTGRYIAVTQIQTSTEKPEPPKLRTIEAGDVVEDLDDAVMQRMIASGAVRRETKDEAKDK